MAPMRKCSSRSSVSARQIRPRPSRAMKLIASGVTFSAASVRSPSFSRSSSSTTIIMRPARNSSSAVGTSVKGGSADIHQDCSAASGSGDDQVHDPEQQRGDGGGGRNGKDPGPQDACGHAPAHGGEPLRGAHAHDGAGDGVGGAHRNAGEGRSYQGESAGGFSAEASHGFEFGDALSHGLDDAPAAQVRPQPHGSMSG